MARPWCRLRCRRSADITKILGGKGGGNCAESVSNEGYLSDERLYAAHSAILGWGDEEDECDFIGRRSGVV